MTAQETERVGVGRSGPVTRTASTKSAGKAYERRMRRQELIRGRRLTATGSPIAAALTKVPFVALIILLLAGGIVGVLWLNTMSDAAGLRASQSRLAQMDLDTRIEAANKDIAALKDPARLATEARALGLVPPGDAAMIQIGADGKVTVIGTPTPVAAAASPTTSAALVPTAAQTTAVQTTAVQTNAVQTTAAKTTAVKTTAAKTTAVKTTAAKTTAAKTTAVKTTAARTTATKTTAVKTTPSKQTPATTGAGQ